MKRKKIGILVWCVRKKNGSQVLLRAIEKWSNRWKLLAARQRLKLIFFNEFLLIVFISRHPLAPHWIDKLLCHRENITMSLIHSSWINKIHFWINSSFFTEKYFFTFSSSLRLKWISNFLPFVYTQITFHSVFAQSVTSILLFKWKYMIRSRRNIRVRLQLQLDWTSFRKWKCHEVTAFVSLRWVTISRV